MNYWQIQNKSFDLNSRKKHQNKSAPN